MLVFKLKRRILMSKEMPFDIPYIEDFEGVTKQIMLRPEMDVKEWSALNPSIGYSEADGYMTLIRSSNYLIDPLTREFKIQTSGDIRTRTWICRLDPTDWSVHDLREIHIADGPSVPRGIEDCRIYWRDGVWYMHGVMLERAHTVPSRVAIYRLDLEENKAYFVQKCEGFDVDRYEKNWMTTLNDSNPHFDFIYSPTGIVKDNKFILKPNTNRTIGSIRGGSSLLLLEDKSYLAVTHSCYQNIIHVPNGKFLDRRVFRKYVHQFVRYDYYGNIIEISPEFLFEGYDVEFAAGLAECGEHFVVSYGIEDGSANIVSIPKKNVFEMLQPIIDEEEW
jgi:hypothetical protein